MTMVLTWPDRKARRHSGLDRLARRLAVAPRLWARRLARRRFLNRVLAETHDPEVLADLGFHAAPRSQTERWIMAVLWHQH